MKLPKKILAKVIKEETLIREKLGDSFYEWVTNPETEIRDYSVIQKITDVLLKHATD